MSLMPRFIATLAAAFAMHATTAQAQLSRDDKLKIITELLAQKEALEKENSDKALNPIRKKSVFGDGRDFVTSAHVFMYTNPAVAVSAFAKSGVTPESGLKEFDEGENKKMDFFKFYANGPDVDAETFRQAFRVYSSYIGVLVDYKPTPSYKTGLKHLLTRETGMLCTWNLEKPADEKQCVQFNTLDKDDERTLRVRRVLAEHNKNQPSP